MPATTILIDIDNTIAQTQRAYIAYANEMVGDARFIFEDITKEYSDNINDPFEALVRNYLTSSNYAQTAEAILPYVGILEAFQSLHLHDFRLCIASSRVENWHEPTVHWLDKHGLLPYIHQIYLRTSDVPSIDFKQQSVIATDATIVFDDSFETAKVLASLKRYYLIDQPWNRQVPELPYVRRTKTFTSGVRELIANKSELIHK